MRKGGGRMGRGVRERAGAFVRECPIEQQRAGLVRGETWMSRE